MKKKGNKKMPRLRQEIIDNPIPTSLFFNGVATHLQVFLKLHPQYPQTTEQLHSSLDPRPSASLPYTLVHEH